jgi:hypothetical protein
MIAGALKFQVIGGRPARERAGRRYEAGRIEGQIVRRGYFASAGFTNFKTNRSLSPIVEYFSLS